MDSYIEKREEILRIRNNIMKKIKLNIRQRKSGKK